MKKKETKKKKAIGFWLGLLAWAFGLLAWAFGLMASGFWAYGFE